MYATKKFLEKNFGFDPKEERFDIEDVFWTIGFGCSEEVCGTLECEAVEDTRLGKDIYEVYVLRLTFDPEGVKVVDDDGIEWEIDFDTIESDDTFRGEAIINEIKSPYKIIKKETTDFYGDPDVEYIYDI